LNRMVNKLKK